MSKSFRHAHLQRMELPIVVNRPVDINKEIVWISVLMASLNSINAGGRNAVDIPCKIFPVIVFDRKETCAKICLNYKANVGKEYGTSCDPTLSSQFHDCCFSSADRPSDRVATNESHSLQSSRELMIDFNLCNILADLTAKDKSSQLCISYRSILFSEVHSWWIRTHVKFDLYPGTNHFLHSTRKYACLASLMLVREYMNLHNCTVCFFSSIHVRW